MIMPTVNYHRVIDCEQMQQIEMRGIEKTTKKANRWKLMKVSICQSIEMKQQR